MDDEDSGAPTVVESPAARTSAPVVRRGPRASIGRRYTLGDEIARGGMGRVVEATDTLLGRTVAIKEALATDDVLLRRFARETRITARLEHPSIVPVHDAGTLPDGSPFYVMRKVSGRPLEQLVSDAKPLAKRLALLPQMLATANAVAHAHARGVLHRDLKPSNILVGPLGETVVIDWGLAKVIDEPDDPSDPFARATDDVHTRAGTIVGTPGFMPPEQLRGEPVDARSDVYALGATLYFVLARRPPHVGQTGDEMITAALAGPPTPIGTLVPGVPRELATIVDKALAYDRGARYRDAGGVAEELDRFLKGQLVASHRYSSRERALRFLRRHRIAVTVAAVAAAALAIGGWFAVARIVRERDRADVALRDAMDRNEALELAHARSLLATNPTAAVARVRPLAAKHWTEARTIAMAARAAGVAHGLSASRTTTSLELARDGRHVLVAGDDGSVRIDELATTASRTVAQLHAPASARYADDDRTVVAWAGTQLAIVDVATGATRELALAAAPVELRAAAATVWWCDRDGAVWSYALAAAAPTRIAVADRIAHVALHDDVAALAGEHHVWLVRAGTASAASDGATSALAWSKDGRLAAISDERVIQLDPGGKLVSRIEWPGATSIAWQGNALYVGAFGTVTPVGELPITVGNQPIDELFAGPDDTIVARSRVGTLAVLGHRVLVDIPPTSAIGVVDASGASPYVVAGSDGIVLEWNLADLLPREIRLPRTRSHQFGAYEQLVVVYDEHAGTWVDVPSGTHDDVDLDGQVVEVELSPDRTHALFVTQDRHAAVYTRGQRTGTPIEVPCAAAAFATPDRIVIGTTDRRIVLYDVTSHAITELATEASAATYIEVRGSWAIALLADGTVWRRDLASGATSRLPPAAERYVLLGDGGDVATSDRTKLMLWHTDGRVEDLAALPPPITWLLRVDAGHLLALAGGDSAYVVELDGSRRATSRFSQGSRLVDLALDGPLGVYSDGSAGLYVTAPLDGASWRLARPLDTPIAKPGISPDGTRVFAFAGTSIVVWTQPVPQTREATLALVDALTNARTTDDSDALSWSMTQR